MTYHWSYSEIMALEDRELEWFSDRISERNREEKKALEKSKNTTKKPRRRR